MNNQAQSDRIALYSIEVTEEMLAAARPLLWEEEIRGSLSRDEVLSEVFQKMYRVYQAAKWRHERKKNALEMKDPATREDGGA